MKTTVEQPLSEVIANPQTIVPKGKAPMVKNLLAQYLQLGEEEKKIQESPEYKAKMQITQVPQRTAPEAYSGFEDMDSDLPF